MSKPNPGSPEAIASGCLCPVIDNHHGKGVPHGKDGAPLFWHSSVCPLHGEQMPVEPPAAIRNRNRQETDHG